jgi:arylsulfatase A-like enzyme
MHGPWDAPLALQQTLRDEGDPPPLESIAPPERTLTENDGPDVAFQYSCAYSAQIMVLDACWRGLVDTITHAAAREQWLVVLIGVRGYPLGEHRQIGGADQRLFAEQLQVPWLIRFPNSWGLLKRTSCLATHLDLLPTLVQWIDESADFAALTTDGSSVLPLLATVRFPWRDALLSASRSSSSRSIRTSSWSLRWDQSNATAGSSSESVAAGGELFVRPDDRWEANDVAKLCPDVVEELTRAIHHISSCLELDQPLPERVLSGEDAAAV